MSVIVRMTRGLREEMLRDLRRPHPHAAERVGFVYGRVAAGATALVLLTRYLPVPDERYVRDESVGARIDGDAIRAAMQAAIDSGDGVFHAHLHEWPGRPEFSYIDEREMPNLVPAFRAVSRGQPAGLFLLSPDSAIADVWLPGSDARQRAGRVVVVGSPTLFFEGSP